MPIAHVEAGLRSFDRAMPEETNRVVIDHLSELLFATEPSAVANLRREGLASDRIHLVGNLMIDSLRHVLPRLAPPRATLAAFGRPEVAAGIAPGYAVVTLHRPANVDGRARLEPLLRTLRGSPPSCR